MKQSDLIAQAILDLMNQANGTAEIQRNELAQKMGCVPSQINYVLTSRFTPEHGYMIESRRGGGGYIRITRVNLDSGNAFMHIINSIGETIDLPSARAMISNLYGQKLISLKAAQLMMAAISDSALKYVHSGVRDIVRASIFKQMLLKLV